uniref:3'(2'),5'-bisphosphate nucleotidase CysQ n=1 Tax=Alloprevotella sp. TaxID=1872471 RepID=UPI004026D7E0
MLDTIIQAALRAGKAIMDIYTHPDLDWQVERKADNSPLTLADRKSHAIIAEALESSPYPLLSEEGAHLPYDERKHWHSLWIVDPLDGTKEFLKKNDEFTVNIALVTDGVPVMGVIYVPAKYRLFWGEKGQGAFTAEVDPETLHIGQAESLPLKEAQLNRPYRVVASRSHLSPETETFINDLRRHHTDLELVSAGSSLKLCLVAEGKADVYPRMAPTMEWDTAAGHAIALAAGHEVLNAETDLPLTYNKEDLHNPWFVVK